MSPPPSAARRPATSRFRRSATTARRSSSTSSSSSTAFGRWSRSARTAGTLPSGRWRRTGIASRSSRGSAMGRRSMSDRTVFTGRITRASKTPSPASSRPRCSTTSCVAADKAGRAPLVDFRRLMATTERDLLRGPRRPARGDGRRDQARVPQARAAVASRRQQGPRGRGAIQGGQRGVPDPVGPRAPPALRHVRPRRRRRRARRAPASRGSAASATSSMRSSAAPRPAARRGGGARSPARTCATTCGSRSRRRSRAPRRRSSSASLARCETCSGSGAKPGTEADDLPAVRRPRRDPQRPPDDARPDGQRQRLPALSRRGQDRRDALRRRAMATAASSASGRCG